MVHVTQSENQSGLCVSATKNNNIPLIINGEPILSPVALPLDQGSIVRIENTLLGFCFTVSPEEFVQTVDLGRGPCTTLPQIKS